MRVLVVDDEVDLANAVAKGLRREGYAVDVAASGREALDALDLTEYDLVCLDLTMPGIDGIEVCRQVRAGACRAMPTSVSGSARASRSASPVMSVSLDSVIRRPPGGLREIFQARSIPSPAHPGEGRDPGRRGGSLGNATIVVVERSTHSLSSQSPCNTGTVDPDEPPRSYSMREYH